MDGLGRGDGLGRNIPTLNQKPTQPPLNREEQEKSFHQLKNQYFTEKKIEQGNPITQYKEMSIGEDQMLKKMKDAMQERGMSIQAKAVEERLEEKQVTATIKQFYCTHVFQLVKANVGILPIKYRICKKCGLVK